MFLIKSLKLDKLIKVLNH